MTIFTRMISAVQKWWNKPSEAELLMRVAKILKISMPLDEPSIKSQLYELRADVRENDRQFKNLEHNLETMLSNSYARVAERQLEVCQKQLETNDKTIHELLKRWRDQVDDLKLDLAEEKKRRVEAEEELKQARNPLLAEIRAQEALRELKQNPDFKLVSDKQTLELADGDNDNKTG